MAGEGESSYALADIAALLGGDVLGDAETRILRVAAIASAGTGDITFLANPKYRSELATCAASAVILRPEVANEFSGARIVTANPYAYYAKVVALLNPRAPVSGGIHPSATVDSIVPASVSIGPNVVIGSGVTLGENVVIKAGCVIGNKVFIGQGTCLYPNVTIYHGCSIGRDCTLHSGTVIGADGFGFAPDGQLWVKIPQIGGVRIGDNVEIGANTTVDRGALEDTIVGDGCKIDNLVHIGHNCRIGNNSVLAGCTGVAGSTVLGEHCIVGGACMISGHLDIVAGTTISGATTVMKSILNPGVYTSLFPLDTHEEWLRNASHIRRLSKLVERVSALEKNSKNI